MKIYIFTLISILLFLFFYSLFNYGEKEGQQNALRGSIEKSSFSKSDNIGKKIIVAVIDTGIDPKHKQLQGQIISMKKDIGTFGKDFSALEKLGKYSPYDDHGHGTHVSAIISRYSPKIRILPLKYYDENGSGQESLKRSVAAIKYATKKKVDIINYSSGGPHASKEEWEALRDAEREGILVVTAAGNEGHCIEDEENKYYPASYNFRSFLTVMAVDEKLDKVPSSNWGKKSVDVAAPGKKIISALPGNKVGRLTGTSQATAFVTGVAAKIKSLYPHLSSSEIKSLIINASHYQSKLDGLCKASGILDEKSTLDLAKEYVEACE